MSDNKINWDQYFMTMAYLIATKSKDPSTKVGAIIVGKDNEIRSTGYNGLPRGINDTYERYQKPLKSYLINHAEENAILHCSRIGISSKNCRLYVPWIPCSLCAKSIIQVGIDKVIYHKSWPGNNILKTSWAASIKISKEILAEANVELIAYDGELIKIQGFYKEKEFALN